MLYNISIFSNMKKSKFIASGTYGCVITPAFNCNTDNDILENSVSKLFTNKHDYEIEIANHNMITSIDKNNDFTLKLISNCEIDTSFINKNTDNIERCDLKNKKDKFYQIIYEYGGYDLLYYFNVKRDIDISIFFKNFIKIIKGIKALIINGITHNDIKLNNILFNGTKISLIDFGLITDIDTLLDLESIYKYKANSRYYYPDELMLYSAIKLNSYSFKHNLLILNSSNLLIYLNEYLHLYMVKYKQLPKYLEEIQKLNKFITIRASENYKFLKTKKNINLTKISKLIGPKLDIYQLGIVLYEVILLCIANYSIKDIINNIPLEIFGLIAKMLEPDSNKRINIDDLIINYSIIMKL